MRESFVRYILNILFLCQLPFSTWAQQTISAHVQDSETEEALPYAKVYVSTKKYSLTNSDGNFILENIFPDEILMIECVGYQPLHVAVSDLPDVVQLHPMESTLDEVTVIPIDNILDKVREKLHNDFKHNRKKNGTYFFRQTNSFGDKKEMTEAFIDAGSAVNLHDIVFRTGRRFRQTQFGTVESRIDYSNLQHLLELAPMLCDVPFWASLTSPLGMNEKTAGSKGANDVSFNSLYNITCETLYSSASRKDRFFRLGFQKKTDRQTILTGYLYVDAESFHVLRFEGIAENLTMELSKELMRESTNTDIILHVNFRHSNGYTEVADLRSTLRAGDLESSSMAFSVDIQDLPSTLKKMKGTENMMDAIDQAGYDSTLWTREIVLRTSTEEQIAWQAMNHETASQEGQKYGDFAPLMEHLKGFGRTIPQEKVYIHLDNTSYFLGDTIWFAAYTRQTSDDRPSKVSGLLYVELLNQDGYLVERKLVEMDKGHGNGFFSLNHQVQYSGFYELRAYTRWQLNWGQYQHDHSHVSKQWFINKERERNYYRDYDKLYSRVFPVYEKPLKAGEYDRSILSRPMTRYFSHNMNDRKLTLTLYPEGGHLVEGVPNRVAFEAAWDDGEWVDGWLHIGSDSVPAVNRGRGIFTLIPRADSSPRIMFVTRNGVRVKGELPKPEKYGVGVSVIEDGKEWRIRIMRAGHLMDDSLALTVMREGVVKYFFPIRDAQTETRFMPTETGVHQVTIFDRSGRIWSDRLFFPYHYGQPTLNVSGVKQPYEPHEQINLHIKSIAEHDSLSPPISISVHDRSEDEQIHDNGTILTEMLLSSEIRGFVPNPGWYFEKDDIEHRQALDLLMMTQGWRRFNWHDMAVHGSWDLTQPDEHAPILTGVVYKNRDWNIIDLNSTITAKRQDKGLNEKSAKDPFTLPRKISDEGNLNETESPKRDLGELTDKAPTLKKDITLHAELIPLSGNGIFNTDVSETTTKKGRFRIQLPRQFGKSILFLGASDKDKWKPGKKYTWVQMAFDEADVPAGHRRKFYVDPADFLVCVDFPYPRFVKPYNYYQTLSDFEYVGMGESELTPSDPQTLKEISVHTRHGGLRHFDDSRPAFLIGAEELENRATDAGMYLADTPMGRSIFGDLGLDWPFVNDISQIGSQGHLTSRISYTAGIDYTHRVMRGLENVPSDSLYAPKYLKLYDSVNKSPTHGMVLDAWKKDRNLGMTDMYVVYTDYCPRLEGDKRYLGSNLPEIQFVGYPYSDGSRRPVYRDRRYILPGFAYPAEFYSPDYSKQTPPEPTDYRRTLYWNPNLQLDENGQARITFYNNSRTTQISVEAEGQASDGTLLWTQ